MPVLPHFPSKAFFAPMAGVSDPALRLICRELGAGLVVTEFTNIHAVVAKAKKYEDIRQFLEFSPLERPLAIQLFGSDLGALEKAIKIVEPYFDIIDYNMGCPAPHITQQMACSALLQEPELTRKIFRTMVKATTRPVTVKMRAGVTKPDRFLQIAQIAQEEGLQMITFHPRTVQQGYSGKADWSLIKELKRNVRIPVVGNGDITTPLDAQRMLQETGCDYVMVGRAACQNPFLFTQINAYLLAGRYEEISWEQRRDYFLRYMKYAQNYSTIKFANIRMQAMNFTRGFEHGKELRLQIGKVQNVTELQGLMTTIS